MYPSSFVIDELRCVFCGFCVEACPVDAIRMDTGLHAVPYDSREQFIYRRELLMSLSDRSGSRLTANTAPRAGRPDAPWPDARPPRITEPVIAPPGAAARPGARWSRRAPAPLIYRLRSGAGALLPCSRLLPGGGARASALVRPRFC